MGLFGWGVGFDPPIQGGVGGFLGRRNPESKHTVVGHAVRRGLPIRLQVVRRVADPVPAGGRPGTWVVDRTHPHLVTGGWFAKLDALDHRSTPVQGIEDGVRVIGRHRDGIGIEVEMHPIMGLLEWGNIRDV